MPDTRQSTTRPSASILFWYLLVMFLPTSAIAATYTIPDGTLPDGCSFDTVQVICGNNLNLRNNDEFVVTSPTRLVISGDFSFGNNLTVNAAGQPDDLSIVVSGNINPGNNAEINANLSVSGSINSSNNAELAGNLIISGNLNLGVNSTIDGNLQVSGTVNSANNVTINGHLSASTINLGQNNEINGNIEAENVNINGGNTVVNGNINATGTVNNNGTVNGYINAANTNNNGEAEEVCDLNENVGGCFGGGGGGGEGVHFYRIQHSGNTVSCEAATILVTACADAGCNTTMEITGGFDLIADGVQNIAAAGSFSATSTAEVEIPLPVPGAYSLSLANVAVPATEGPQCLSPSGCDLNVVEAAFKWETLPDQVAGVPFAAQLRAIRTDDESGACVAALQGQTSVDLALDCVNPASCSSGGALLSAAGQAMAELPASTQVELNFDAGGSAEVTLDYEDAGAIALYANRTLPGGATLSGVSNAFVVIPDTVGFSFATAPNDYPPVVFARAGEEFTATLSALTANGNSAPNFGNESVPALLTLATTAQTVLPAGGANGQVSTPAPFVSVGDGSFSSSQVRYNEVGSVVFLAVFPGDQYLGVPMPPVASPVLGRFIPWEFSVDLGMARPACTEPVPGFTYMDDTLSVSLDISALNRDGDLTANYPDGSGGPAVAKLSAADHVASEDLTSRLDPEEMEIIWSEGTGTLELVDLTVNRELLDEKPDGPFPDFQLATVIDDNEEGGPFTPTADADFNAAVGDCADTGECVARTVGVPSRVVFGRLFLANAYGSENEGLEVDLRAQQWNGEYFTDFADDSCTTVDFSRMMIDSSDPPELQDATSAGGALAELEEGRSPIGSLFWAAPEMTGELRFSYDAPPWLHYLPEDSEAAEEGDPSARAQFGRYRGHDRVLHWRTLP